MKMWKCLCRKSEFTIKGQVLVGNIYSEGDCYFSGAILTLSKKGDWECEGTINLTKADFEKCVERFWEI